MHSEWIAPDQHIAETPLTSSSSSTTFCLVRDVELADQERNRQKFEFWGGDLPSASAKFDDVAGLGTDVVYLNPIHRAYTNHNFKKISPEFGTRIFRS